MYVSKIDSLIDKINTRSGPISKIDTYVSEVDIPINKIGTPSGPIDKIDTYLVRKQKAKSKPEADKTRRLILQESNAGRTEMGREKASENLDRRFAQQSLNGCQK